MISVRMWKSKIFYSLGREKIFPQQGVKNLSAGSKNGASCGRCGMWSFCILSQKKFSEFYAVIIVCTKKKRTFANRIINAICGDCINASSALGF